MFQLDSDAGIESTDPIARCVNIPSFDDALAPFISIDTTQWSPGSQYSTAALQNDDNTDSTKLSFSKEYAKKSTETRLPSMRGGEIFFARLPDGIFNLVSSFIKMNEFGKLHHVLHSSMLCHTHWEAHLRQYVHHTKPLFDEFTSIEALRWTLLVRKIDAPRDWELHLEGPKGPDGKTTILAHWQSFAKVSEMGDLKLVKAMVETTQVDLEMMDSDGRTPLHCAAFQGHLPVLQYLCEQGADVEARGRHAGAQGEGNEDENDGEWHDWSVTPLHLAADKGHLPVVQYLCEQGADKEARTNGGGTPLHKAAFKGHLPVVQNLCEQGADKEARTNGGNTLLPLAAFNGHLPVVQYLCEQGADKEARNEYDWTPLLMAAYEGHLSVVQ